MTDILADVFYKLEAARTATEEWLIGKKPEK